MSLLPFQQFASTRISIVNLQIVHNRVGYVHKEESIRILYVIRRYVEKRKEKRVFNCTEKAQLKWQNDKNSSIFLLSCQSTGCILYFKRNLVLKSFLYQVDSCENEMKKRHGSFMIIRYWL